MISRQQAFRRLVVIILLYSVFGLAYSVIIPLQEAPDEMAHFLYSRFITKTGHLPLDQEQRLDAGYLSFWPGLYHAVVAAAVGWSYSDQPPLLKFAWESPQYSLTEELIDVKPLVNTEDELWPYRGQVLMWHLGRGVSLLFGAATLIIAFFTALEIRPKNYRLATWSAALLAFVPGYIYISSVISYESLIGFFTGLYFWVLAKIFARQRGWWVYVGLGLLLGLSVTVKYSAVILPLQVMVVFTYLAWQRQWGWQGWLKWLAITGAATIIGAAWWFTFLIIYFNQIDQYGWLIGALKPIIAGGIDPAQNYVAAVLTGGAIGATQAAEMIPEPFWAWAVELYNSFWLARIQSWPYGPFIYALMGGVMVIAAISLVHSWRRRVQTRDWLALLLFHVGLFIVFPLLRFLIQGNIAWTAQGRHVLFPAATILPLLLMYGWDAWLPLKKQQILALVIVAGLMAASLAQLVRLSSYYPPPFPIRAAAEVLAHIPNRLDARFGEHLTLLGYELQPMPADGALKVSLYWQSSTYPPEDYLLNLTLQQSGQPAFSWRTYPLNAQYPTRLWENYEIIRDDVWLPVVDLPAGDYQLLVQLQGEQGPLPVAGDNALALAAVTLPRALSPAPAIPLLVQVSGRPVVAGVTIWQAEKYYGRPSPRYYPRMAIPLVWQGQPAPGERVDWLLVDSNGQVYPTQPLSDHVVMAQIGLDWSSDDYRLRAEVWRDQTVVASAETGPLVSVRNRHLRRMTPPVVENPLEANFAGQVKLLGFNLPDRSLTTGQGVPVTLYWQGLQAMDSSYTVFTKLLDDEKQVWASAERLPADGYDTRLWWKNEYVLDSFELPVDPNIPPGLYWLNVGLYQELDGAAVSLPLLLSGQVSDVTSLTFGPIKYGSPPVAALQLPQQVAPQVNTAVDLGQPPVIQLRGYDFNPLADTIRLTLYWESVAPTGVNWNVFVHLRDAANVTVAQMDQPAGAGQYPTVVWEPGQIIADNLTIPLPADLPAGEYALMVGLYNLADGVRLPLTDSPSDEILLTLWHNP